jgi:hypothetical protein
MKIYFTCVYQSHYYNHKVRTCELHMYKYGDEPLHKHIFYFILFCIVYNIYVI